MHHFRGLTNFPLIKAFAPVSSLAWAVISLRRASANLLIFNPSWTIGNLVGGSSEELTMKQKENIVAPQVEMHKLKIIQWQKLDIK